MHETNCRHYETLSSYCVYTRSQNLIVPLQWMSVKKIELLLGMDSLLASVLHILPPNMEMLLNRLIPYGEVLLEIQRRKGI